MKKYFTERREKRSPNRIFLCPKQVFFAEAHRRLAEKMSPIFHAAILQNLFFYFLLFAPSYPKILSSQEYPF